MNGEMWVGALMFFVSLVPLLATFVIHPTR